MEKTKQLPESKIFGSQKDSDTRRCRTPILSNQLGALLLSSNIKRSYVIEKAEISPSTLAQYISGKNTPKLSTLCKLADIFDISLDELVCGESFTSSVDLNPIEEALERRLDSLLSRVSERRDLSVRVGMHLADQIDDAVQSLKLSNSIPGGFLTDDEIMLLELISEETWIGSMNLAYDIQEDDGAAQTGRFAKIVASNLKRGNKYKFLIPAHIDEDKSRKLAIRYKSILRETYKCTPNEVKRCEFRLSEENQYSGVVFYKLNIDGDIPGKTRLLLEKIKSFTESDGRWLGYVIPPSGQVHGDVLMDSFHLKNGQEVFKQRWERATRIN